MLWQKQPFFSTTIWHPVNFFYLTIPLQSRRLNLNVFLHFFFPFFNQSMYIYYSCLFFHLFSVSIHNISQFRVHIFLRCFYCFVQLLQPLVFQFLLSLCLSPRSHHSNLVSSVTFLSFLPFLFVFCFGFLLCTFSFLCAFVFS